MKLIVQSGVVIDECSQCISSDRYQHVGVSNVEVTKSEQVEDTDMVNMGHLERSLQSSDSNSSVDSETESDNVSQNYSAPIGISHEVGTTRSQGEKLKGRYVSLQETNSDDNDEVREFGKIYIWRIVW